MIKNQIWLAKSYLNYFAKAKTRYKVHSPFVFDLVENVLKDKTKYPEFKKIETYKKNISRSKTIIETVDFGARSENNNYTTTLERLVIL